MLLAYYWKWCSYVFIIHWSQCAFNILQPSAMLSNAWLGTTGRDSSGSQKTVTLLDETAGTMKLSLCHRKILCDLLYRIRMQVQSSNVIQWIPFGYHSLDSSGGDEDLRSSIAVFTIRVLRNSLKRTDDLVWVILCIRKCNPRLQIASS